MLTKTKRSENNENIRPEQADNRQIYRDPAE